MSVLKINILKKMMANAQSQATVVLDGNLDNSTVPSLEPKLTEVLAGQPNQLVFDLGKLKYVTSAGIRLFLLASKQQKQRNSQTAFIHLQPQIKEVFDIMGTLRDMQIFKDVAELDAYLLARQRLHHP